jgi:hypothetical protein
VIKRGNQAEAINKVINQLAAEKGIIYLSIANQIHILSLIPILDFFRLGLVDYLP